MNRIGWVAGALVVVTLAASCGQSGPSKAEYIAQGDALCVGVRHQLDAIPAPSTATQIAAYLDRSLAINRGMLARLRSLTPPPGDEQAVRKVLSDFDGILAKGKSAEATAASGDDTATDVAIKELAMSVEKAGAEARAYGFKSCGSAASGADASGTPGPSPSPSPSLPVTPAPDAVPSTGPVPTPGQSPAP